MSLKIKALILGLTLLAVFGCRLPDRGVESGTEVDLQPTPPPAPPPDPTKTVCNPFDGDSQTQVNGGLVGKLYYTEVGEPHYPTASDYIAHGHAVDADLFFNRVFVPTRPFDRGFVLESGDLVTTPNGDSLYEYFGLHLESLVKLGADDPVANYQFAVLADDGAVLKIKDTDLGYRTIVDDDGVHPTQMKCATEPVSMNRSTRLPINIDYYQGPRYHISLVVLWRPWPNEAENPVNDPLCNQAGNSLFFDSTANPVAAQPAFYSLLERGWRVLEIPNYQLPPQYQATPCPVDSTPVQITGLDVKFITQTSATVTWFTNIPSSSQIFLTIASTGATSVSDLDTSFVTTHSVPITGLTSNTLYAVTAKSVSPGGSFRTSDPRTFRTLR